MSVAEQSSAASGLMVSATEQLLLVFWLMVSATEQSVASVLIFSATEPLLAAFGLNNYLLECDFAVGFVQKSVLFLFYIFIFIYCICILLFSDRAILCNRCGFVTYYLAFT